jgi:hypothetical protein
MAKKLGSHGLHVKRDLPRVHLIPAKDLDASDPMRQKEIVDIVVQIILLGRCRRRPSKKDMETKNAA